jgi:hypothetical protein
MIRLSRISILTCVLSAAFVLGCNGDDTPASTGTETDGNGDGDPTTGDGDPETGDGDPETGDGDPETGDGDPECATHEPGDGLANGEPCTSNGECASKLCEVFQDVPPVEGTCEPAPDDCRTRIMGRTLDFMTREPVAGASLRVAPAIMASVDPVNAMGVATGTSAADGIIDILSDGQIVSALGIVGLTEADGYYLTATGLASPAEGTLYGPANAIRDIWAVPSSALTLWSNVLAEDETFDNLVPLGDNGGVVGLVRNGTTGEPIAGAIVFPTNGDGSNALVRYLSQDADDIVETETSQHGVFIIVQPALAETFGVMINGEPVEGVVGTAGSANGAIFTLIMNI